MSFPTKLPKLVVALLLLTWMSVTPMRVAAKATKATTMTTTIKVQCFNATMSDSPSTLILSKDDWRDDTLIYQIWPKSFQDSDGDGRGDLQGKPLSFTSFRDASIKVYKLFNLSNIIYKCRKSIRLQLLKHNFIKIMLLLIDRFCHLIYHVY
jgi:hypothetical protein